MMDIKEFIFQLQNQQSTNTLTNAYETSIISRNLEIYLKNMIKLKPDTLFIGEAPGYKGCARTGIPFTDEFHMINTENEVLGEKYGYQVIEPKNQIEKELSATTIWSVLEKIDKLPLMWNAFPYHPHKENVRLSNRTPSKNEIELGIEYIRYLLKMFQDIKHIYAIGKTAERLLKRYGINCEYIRHPAHGGSSECIKIIKNILWQAEGI